LIELRAAIRASDAGTWYAIWGRVTQTIGRLAKLATSPLLTLFGSTFKWILVGKAADGAEGKGQVQA
jgi:hypothetical protein